MPLRCGLGVYGRPARFLAAHALNLHDLGELIRRAGWYAGFIVESEWQIPGPRRRRIDWVWLDTSRPGTPMVAFEIEGPAVPQDSLDSDRERFAAAGSAIEIVALYQVDHNRTVRDARVAEPVSRARHLLQRPAIRVLLSETLMAPGGIEEIQREALAIVGRVQGPSVPTCSISPDAGGFEVPRSR